MRPEGGILRDPHRAGDEDPARWSQHAPDPTGSPMVANDAAAILCRSVDQGVGAVAVCGGRPEGEGEEIVAHAIRRSRSAESGGASMTADEMRRIAERNTGRYLTPEEALQALDGVEA